MAIWIRNVTNMLRSSARSLATLVTPLPTGSTAEHDGPLRTHLNVPVDPNHGLYGFFRVKTDRNSHSTPKGEKLEYVSVELPDAEESGRSWNVSELRRKSFKDLHMLWYILLRERNLLATQRAERVRINSPLSAEEAFALKTRKCQKSMARIKAVITERRNAYSQAAWVRRALYRNGELLQPAKPAPDGEGMLEGEAEQKETP